MLVSLQIIFVCVCVVDIEYSEPKSISFKMMAWSRSPDFKGEY